MTIEALSPAVRASTETLRREFAAAQPFRHAVIDHFIDAAICDRLIAEFPPFGESNAVNELGEVGRKAVIPDIARISAAYAEFDRLMRSKDFLHWLGEVTSIGNLLYDPEYIGGGTHENLTGQDLDWHVDFNYHPRRPLHRRLNLILFLNREWQPEWGGSLELHHDPWNSGANACVRSIVPVANRCVVFETTEASWHGFSRIHARGDGGSRSRRSIAVYFYTKERPASETAPPHGTIYVPHPLPRHFEAGYTLQPEDAHELETLFSRRDRQIRYLYERELAFAKTLAGVYRSPSFRIGRALTWPLRKLMRK